MSGRREYPDPTPVEVPLGFRRPPTLQEEIQRLIRVQMSQQARDTGLETFEEANDFEVDEDPDPLSQYEVVEMAPEPPTAQEVDEAAPAPKASMGDSSPPAPVPVKAVEPPKAMS